MVTRSVYWTGYRMSNGIGEGVNNRSGYASTRSRGWNSFRKLMFNFSSISSVLFLAPSLFKGKNSRLIGSPEKNSADSDVRIRLLSLF